MHDDSSHLLFSIVIPRNSYRIEVKNYPNEGTSASQQVNPQKEKPGREVERAKNKQAQSAWVFRAYTVGLWGTWQVQAL